MREEIFGPILPLVTYEQPEEVFARLDMQPTPLALYWFGKDRARLTKIFARTRSGGVAINDTIMHVAVEGLRFGGMGASGTGAYHGRAAFDAFPTGGRSSSNRAPLARDYCGHPTDARPSSCCAASSGSRPCLASPRPCPMPNPIETRLRTALEAVVDRVAASTGGSCPRAKAPFWLEYKRRRDRSLRSKTLWSPAGLIGRYLKMGVNSVALDPAGHHWFLGDDKVHGIAIEDGRSRWYHNRWIASRLAAAALHREPAPGPRRGRNHTVNTNVVDIGGRAFALVAAGSFPVELSDTLETQRYSFV